MNTFLQGFLITGGLIIAIGAQNAFVLKKALLKQHTFWIALTCFLCDLFLISIGVLGLGSIISHHLLANQALTIFGIVFLFFYGFRAFKAAYQGNSVLAVEQNASKQTALQTVLLTISISLLNPHAYLDTVVIIGSIASSLDFSAKRLFLFGALTTSALWFFGLAYGARLLIPLFQRPITWRILDIIIGIIMWLIAASLTKYAFSLF